MLYRPSRDGQKNGTNYNVPILVEFEGRQIPHNCNLSHLCLLNKERRLEARTTEHLCKRRNAKCRAALTEKHFATFVCSVRLVMSKTYRPSHWNSRTLCINEWHI